VHLISPESAVQLRELVDGVERQCPSLDTITRGVTITGTVEINDPLECIGVGSYLAQCG